MAGPDALIKTEGLGRDFGRTRALDKVDLVLEAGAPIGLVGPNGAGKTTFFSVLCGFLRPTRGTVEVMGRPPLHRDLHGRVAILPQDAQFIKGVPVLSQLAMLAELQGFSAAAAREEAARALQMVLLADAARKPPEAMSHGMLKRIAIAQAFLGAPELVLLDEPTAGLDPATASEMKNLIRSLDKERTFIVSSHNLQDIEELCGSVVILDHGKIVEHRKVSELVARTSCLTFRLEADPPETIVGKLTSVPLVTRVELGRPGERRLAVHFRDQGDAGGNTTQIAVLQALTAAGIGMIEMTRGQSLQDKVIEMTRPAQG
ncbi:MAG TPA: ABC transporter ATP-binding protein [Polyangia bacterium]|nr:ABC transporter ATP-binding protein [Polyangia bacterium]